MEKMTTDQVQLICAVVAEETAKQALKLIGDALRDHKVPEDAMAGALVTSAMTSAQILALQCSKAMAAGVRDGTERRVTQRRLYVSGLNQIREGGVRFSFADIAHIPVNLESPDET